ncbi:TIGR02444 family protein, partial [Vibrio sp. 10N.222.49.E5]
VDYINSLQLFANQQAPLAFQYCRLLGAENLYVAFSEPAPQP